MRVHQCILVHEFYGTTHNTRMYTGIPVIEWGSLTPPARPNACHIPNLTRGGTNGFVSVDGVPPSSGDSMSDMVKIHLSRVSKMSTFTVPRTEMRKYRNPGSRCHTVVYCQYWVRVLCRFVGSVSSFCGFILRRYCP